VQPAVKKTVGQSMVGNGESDAHTKTYVEITITNAAMLNETRKRFKDYRVLWYDTVESSFRQMQGSQTIT
jgi:hypothetical protein